MPATKTVQIDGATTRGGLHETSQRLAGMQHGVVGRSQLIAAGIAGTSIDRFIGKRLFPLFPGVYAVGRPQIGRDGLMMAGVLCGGCEAAIGYRSAAAMWGMVRPRPGVEIIRPRHRLNFHSKVELDGIERSVPLVARRTRNLPAHHIRKIREIPVTSVPRTLLDLASVLPVGALERAFLEADRLGLMEDRELMEVVSRGNGHRGASNLRRLVAGRLPDLEDLRSVLEAMFLSLCRDEGIPRPETNVLIGPYEVDCLWRAERLIVELDGYEFHRGIEKLERDADRSGELRARGWSTMRVTWRMVTKSPVITASRIRAALSMS